TRPRKPDDDVVDAGLIERLLHAPTGMSPVLHPDVLAAVQLDGHGRNPTPTPRGSPGAAPLAGDVLGLGRARSLGAQGDARGRREEVVEDQQLDQSERLRTMEVGADRDLAEPVRTQMAREVKAVPDHLLERAGALSLEAAGDAKVRLAVDLADPNAVAL